MTHEEIVDYNKSRHNTLLFVYIGSIGSNFLSGFSTSLLSHYYFNDRKYQIDKKCLFLEPIRLSPSRIRAEVAPKVSPLIGAIFLKLSSALVE